MTSKNSNRITITEEFDSGSSDSASVSFAMHHSFRNLGLLVEQVSGDISGLVLNIEASDDEQKWFKSKYTSGVIATSGNTSMKLEGFPFDFLRVVVGTPSTESSTIKIIAVGR